MKADITTESDIKKLVDVFYDKVKSNNQLGPIFETVMKVDWQKHLPKMYKFWGNIVFQTGEYKGFPFAAHMPVNGKTPLTPQLFNEWLNLFHAAIDELFSGPVAENLKFKSENIKEVWSVKMEYVNAHPIN
jgi:hemoglobin